MHQRVIILGNLGGDPEMRYMPDGTAVTNISVATNRTWKDNSGQRVSETTWFRVAFWGPVAEVINQYFEKGKPIYVEGRMVPDPETGGPKIFTRSDGSVGATYEVKADKFSFTPRSEGSPYQGGQQQQQQEQTTDDIPF